MTGGKVTFQKNIQVFVHECFLHLLKLRLFPQVTEGRQA